MADPRGIRNNNPCNVRCVGDKWRGLTGKDDHGFCRFETPAHGIRAAALTLQTYQEKHDVQTLRGVIERWAPPTENDTSAYIASVSIWADIEPDDPIDLFDYDTVLRLVKAMVRVENGRPPQDRPPAWYEDEIYERGLRMAGLVPGKPLTRSRTARGAAVASGGAAAAVGVLTHTFGVPPEIANMLPALLAHLTPEQVAVVLGMISLAGALYTLYARHDDKRKGRL